MPWIRLSIRYWLKLKMVTNGALVNCLEQERVASLLVTRFFFALAANAVSGIDGSLATVAWCLPVVGTAI
jgi:hypothetical protein